MKGYLLLKKVIEKSPSYGYLSSLGSKNRVAPTAFFARPMGSAASKNKKIKLHDHK
jgi:hypothetical protein